MLKLITISPLALPRRLRAVLKIRWERLSRPLQHFIIAVMIGVGIEVGLHAAQHLDTIRDMQNLVLDSTLRVFSLTDKLDTVDKRFPVLLLNDDMSSQSPIWGGDRAMTLPQALKLVSHAFDRGASHVLLDVTFDDSPEAFRPEDRVALSTFIEKFSTQQGSTYRHLYVARSLRVDPCFPALESRDTLRPAIWDAVDKINGDGSSGLVIHPVLPHYHADSDQVVRGWHLFGVARKAGSEPPSWQFLPSPQLAYASAKSIPSDKLHVLPWLAASTSGSSQSRVEFAAESTSLIPFLTSNRFQDKLCRDHSDTLGCTTAHLESRSKPLSDLNPEELLHDVNSLIRPLPVEHACRSQANELLLREEEMSGSSTDFELLYNRIVYQLPIWHTARTLSERGYYIRTPLTLSNDSLDWSDRLVAIGAANENSGDWHATPIGLIPGVLINLNAMLSLERLGPISTPPTWLSILLNGLLVAGMAALFTKIDSAKAAAMISLSALVLSIYLFHEFILSRGIWIEFGIPVIAITIYQSIKEWIYEVRREAINHAMIMTECRQQSLAPREHEKM